MNIAIEFIQIILTNCIVFLGITFIGKLFSPFFLNIRKDKVFFNFLIDVLVGLILVLFIYFIIF